MPFRKFYITILPIFILAFSGCLKDVPHDNPFDPESSDYGFNLSGIVQTYYPPHRGIEGALVQLTELNLATITNKSGIFFFSGLLPGQYTLHFSVKEYASDSLTVYLTGDTTQNMRLDGLPKFEKIQLTTHHEWRHFPVGDHSFLDIKANVSDLDGFADLKKVYFDVHKFGTDSIIVQDTLVSSINPGEFVALLDVAELNTANIQDLVGHEFVFYVEDDAGESVASADYFISRVLSDTLDLESHLVTNDFIEFKWKPAMLAYHIDQYIQLYLVNIGALSLFDVLGPIEQNVDSTRIVNDLPDGIYVWRVQHVDAFGNTNLSKEASFTIETVQ